MSHDSSVVMVGGDIYLLPSINANNSAAQHCLVAYSRVTMLPEDEERIW